VHLHTERLGAGRPRLVLVHGFTQTGRSWSAIAGDLARDHEVVLVDAPGHGGSSQACGDLPAGAHALAEAGGDAVYVGYSMGGRLCLQLALDEPDRVLGLVLLGATAGIVDDSERAARRAADEALAADLERDGLEVFLERWLALPLFAGLSPDAAGVDDRRRNTVAGLAASLRLGGTGSQADLWGCLGRLDAPVLVLAGERDAKFTGIGRELAATIGGNARFEAIADAGHAAHLERPASFLEALRRWLTERGW
jgi:2-succinyl-6-hydroxy-2,4-cyclohexadiene-1-carboxylate synthase